MNRLLRGLLGSIGDISPSKSNAACMELNKKDREHLEHILECIRENKKHSRIANRLFQCRGAACPVLIEHPVRESLSRRSGAN